jgi:hypothetical protein
MFLSGAMVSRPQTKTEDDTCRPQTKTEDDCVVLKLKQRTTESSSN